MRDGSRCTDEVEKLAVRYEGLPQGATRGPLAGAAAPGAATVLTAEGAEAAAATEDANHGLVNFQLVPKVGASCQ